jgi:hypothetical protein
LSVCNKQFSDFAYQAHIKREKKSGYTTDKGEYGLIFRSNRDISTCYKFYFFIDEFHDYEHCNLVVMLKKKKVAFWEYGESGNFDALLAVVAQGGILDLYLNFRHVARIDDFNISSGQIGVFTDGFNIAVTHAKVWSKEGASIDKGKNAQGVGGNVKRIIKSIF